MNAILPFITGNAGSIALWILAALGVWALVGKNLGHALFVLVHGVENTTISVIPDKLGAIDISELKVNAKMLCQQADAWAVGPDGKTKFDWALAALCKRFPIVASVGAPILQNAFNEYKSEVVKNQTSQASPMGVAVVR